MSVSQRNEVFEQPLHEVKKYLRRVCVWFPVLIRMRPQDPRSAHRLREAQQRFCDVGRLAETADSLRECSAADARTKLQPQNTPRAPVGWQLRLPPQSRLVQFPTTEP